MDFCEVERIKRCNFFVLSMYKGEATHALLEMGAKAQAVPAKDAMIQAVVTFMMLLVLDTEMSNAACVQRCVGWL